MKETTVLNQISKIINQLNYKSVFVEIKTKDNTWTLEKERSGKIGFESGTKHSKVGR